RCGTRRTPNGRQRAARHGALSQAKVLLSATAPTPLASASSGCDIPLARLRRILMATSSTHRCGRELRSTTSTTYCPRPRSFDRLFAMQRPPCPGDVAVGSLGAPRPDAAAYRFLRAAELEAATLRLGHIEAPRKQAEDQ